jgi:tuberculosinol/isotuberculosinol synthase
MLEYPDEAASGCPDAYLRTTWRRQVELYKLFFDHGVDTLLTPIFGPDLLERGEEYVQLLEPGLSWFTRDQEMLDFYDTYDVRVRVYGDAQRYLQDTPYVHVLDAFDELDRRTAAHSTCRLFFGVCAHDATETVAAIGARFCQENGYLPSRRQIVEAYYGEYVAPVDLFIGFDRLSAFDMPLIAIGSEDLYFTVSPSPYVDVYTLRSILYDHLYSRRVEEQYGELTPGEWQTMSDFYTRNCRHVLGVGRKHQSGQFWYPLPQLDLPPQMAEEVRLAADVGLAGDE